MNRSIVRRPLTALLALLMVISLFTVCSFGASAETIDLKLKTFTGQDLYNAAEAVGTQNDADSPMPIYTSYQDAIGRRSTAPGGNMIDGGSASHWVGGSVGGELNYKNGDTLTLVARVGAEDLYVSGDLVNMEFAFDAYLGAGIIYDNIITYDMWSQAEERVDPDTGVTYKEFEFEMELDHADFDINNDSLKNGQIRVHPLNDASVSLYYYSITNKTTGITFTECDGLAISTMGSFESSWENIYTDSDAVSGVASYYSNHDMAIHRDWNFAPYCFSPFGASRDNPYLLMEGLGVELPAGVYALDIEMMTHYALSTLDKCLIEVYEGSNLLTEKVISANEVNNQVGQDSGKYGTYRVLFNVPETSAGKKVTFTIYLFDSCDIKFRTATFVQPGVDATMPEASQTVQDQIHALAAGDAEAVTAARNAYDALDFIGQAWVGEEALAKLEMMEAAVEVVEKIAALGSKEDITADNYADKTAALEEAEKSYNNFVKLYGRSVAEAQITNYAALTELRTAHDTVKEAAEKEAAIQKANDAITAIGGVDEITKENVDAKQDLVDAAKAAVDELTTAYGQDILSDVSNYANIQAAQDKIDELKAVPDYTLGDANEDGEINASDALLALQHSVKLTELKDAVFSAADVDASEVVDATDALFILQYSVKLIDKFPAQQAAE